MNTKDFQKLFPTLPYKFKSNPNPNELKAYVAKHQKIAQIMMWISPILFIGTVWEVFSENYDLILMPFAFIYFFFFFKNRRKKLTLSENTIDEYINSVSKQ